MRIVVGSRGTSVEIAERADRPGVVIMRYSDPARSGRDRRVKQRVPLTVRNVDGSLVDGIEARLRRIAESQVMRLEALALGQHSLLAYANMTVEQAIDRATAAEPGRLFLGSGRHARDAERYLRRLALEGVGAHRLWRTLRPADIVAAWERWADGHVMHNANPKARAPNSGRGPGHRALEIATSALERLTHWLLDAGMMEPNASPLPHNWRRELHRVWAMRAGTRHHPARPRHTRRDLQDLLTALASAEVDPRLALALDLGVEVRLGQVIAARFSDVQWNADGEALAVRVATRGGKTGGWLALTHAQAQRLGACMRSGYLCLLERARLQGQIHDYPLFPGGKLRAGKVPVHRKMVQWNRRSALTAFRKLESIAGVESQPARGWYGLRRLCADLVPDLTTDNVVLASVGMHSTETRDRIYRQRDNPQVLEKARAVRTELRALLVPQADQSQVEKNPSHASA